MLNHTGGQNDSGFDVLVRNSCERNVQMRVHSAGKVIPFKKQSGAAPMKTQYELSRLAGIAPSEKCAC